MQYKNLTLDPFQAEAIGFVKERRSVLVSAPTGVGKTIIADFVVEQSIRHGERVIYTAPIKALSNQKYREFTRDHDPSLVGLVTGDLVLNPDAPVVIMTTEILRNMLLQRQEELESLAYVIFDEIHFLGDLERGTVWEETLIYLPPQVKILGLSATISNMTEFARWLSFVRQEEVKIIMEKERKVPLELLIANRHAGVLPPDSFRQRFARKLQRLEHQLREERGWDFRSSSAIKATTRHFEVIEMIRETYLPCLYFVFSRRLTETYARELERRTDRSFLDAEERRRLDAALSAFLEENEIDLSRHAPMYRKGIAFHHAGLNVRLKWLVEHLYEKRLIKVLYCTSTFALGMNMPARSVVFDDIRKYDGRAVVPLTTLQFMQKAGRAGRRGMDEKGYVIIKQDFLHFLLNQPFLATYEKGKAERIESTFNLSFNSIVNLIERYPIETIKTIIQKSFRNFKRREILERTEKEIARLHEERHEIDTPPCAPSEALHQQRIERLEAEIEARQRQIEEVHRQAMRHFTNRRPILEKMGLLEELTATGGNIGDALRVLHAARTERFRKKDALRIISRLERALDADALKIRRIKEDILGLRRLQAFDPCRACENHDACLASPKRRFPRRLAELSKRLRKEERRIFKDFFDKLQLLEEIGYITENYEHLAGAKVLKEIQIEEILVTEMILEGIFEGLESEELFAVCASVCYTFPRSERVRIRLQGKFQELAQRIATIRSSHTISEAERVSGTKYVYCPEMLHFGYLWAKGHSLAEIALQLNTETDITGDLINAFRRARDLLRQLRDAYRDDGYMTERLSHAIWLISRDEVNVID